MNKFKINKILILSLLFIFIIGISTVNASSNDNMTDNNMDILTSNDVNENSISTSQEENVLNDIGDASFTELNTTINTGGNVIELTQNYAYRLGDSNDGITIAKDNIIINGNGHTIDGNGESRIFTITGNNVTLNNLIITGAKIEDIYTIHNNDYLSIYKGGAITWLGDNGCLNNSQITDNVANVTTIFSPDYYTGSININTVAGIIWSGANGTIDHTTFKNNNATKTGGSNTVYSTILWRGANATINNSIFINNNAIDRVLRFSSINGLISNSKFTNNTGYSTLYTNTANITASGIAIPTYLLPSKTFSNPKLGRIA